jgi:acetyl esterase/lipase
LLCAVFDFAHRMRERNTTPGTTEIMSNLAYLGPHFLSKHLDPLVSPIYAANLDRFPPTYLSCGDQDPTLPQSLRMAGALASVGVSTTLSVVSGVDHEFLLMPDSVPAVAQERQRLLSWLDEQAGDGTAGTEPRDSRTPNPHTNLETHLGRNG